MADGLIIPQIPGAVSPDAIPKLDDFSKENATAHDVISRMGQNQKDIQALAGYASGLGNSAQGAIMEQARALQAKESYSGQVNQKINQQTKENLAAAGMDPDAPGYIINDVMSRMKNNYIQHADLAQQLQEMTSINPLQDPLGYLGAAFKAPSLDAQLTNLEDQIKHDVDFVGKAGELATSVGKSNAIAMAANANTLADLTNAATAAAARKEASESSLKFTSARAGLLEAANAASTHQLNAITIAQKNDLEAKTAPIILQHQAAQANISNLQSQDATILNQKALMASAKTGIRITSQEYAANDAATGGYYGTSILHDTSVDMKTKEVMDKYNIADPQTAKSIVLTGRNTFDLKDPWNIRDEKTGQTQYEKDGVVLGPTIYGSNITSMMATYERRPDLQNRAEYVTLKNIYDKARMAADEVEKKSIADGRGILTSAKMSEIINSQAELELATMHKGNVSAIEGGPFAIKMGTLMDNLKSISGNDPLLNQMQAVYGVSRDPGTGKIVNNPTGAQGIFNPDLFITHASQLLAAGTINMDQAITSIQAAINQYALIRNNLDPSSGMGRPTLTVSGNYNDMAAVPDMTNRAAIQAALVRQMWQADMMDEKHRMYFGP